MSLPDPASNIRFKLCKVCGVTKPTNEFPHWRAKCKECLKVLTREQRREINARYYARRKELADRQQEIEDGHDTDDDEGESETGEHKSPIPRRDFEDLDSGSEEEADLDDMEFLAPPGPLAQAQAQLRMNLDVANDAQTQIITLLERIATSSRNTEQLLERFLRLQLQFALPNLPKLP
jgi:hypothetical protein